MAATVIEWTRTLERKGMSVYGKLTAVVLRAQLSHIYIVFVLTELK